MNELQTLYFKLLEKMASIEEYQLIAHLPKMADEASSERLRMSLLDHLEETRDQKQRILDIFSEHDHSPSGGQDIAFKYLLSESEDELSMIEDNATRDAFIIASAQTVEHLEMAKYTTLINWAKELDDSMAEDLLNESRDEEKAADKKLSSIAEGGFIMAGINEKAVR